MPHPTNQSAFRRQSVYPTPDLRDLIFYEVRDDTVDANKIPDEYGKKHRDYPDHRLVLISELDENQRRRWYYAADRDDQYKYNKVISYPYNGRKRFPRITRTIIERRTSYEDDLTTPAMGTADTEYASAQLISERQVEVPDDRLKSLYVAVVRIFDTIPDPNDATDLDELEKFGYRVVYPFGDENFPRVIWTFPVEIDDYNPAGVGTACTIDSSGDGGEDYTALKLSDEQMAPGPDGNVGNVTKVYDTLPGPTLDTVSKRNPIGIPESFIVSSTTTQENTRKATGSSPTTPSGDPVDAESVVESVVQPEGQSHYLDRLVDTKSSVTVGTLVRERLDPQTGGLITVTQTLVDKSTASGSAPDANGLYTEVQPLSQYKSIQVSGRTTDLAINTVTWEEQEDVYWPPVLESLTFATIDKFVEIGGGDTYAAGVYVSYKLKEYAGTSRVVYTRRWFNTAPAAETLTPLVAKPLRWSFIRFRGSVPACLHSSITLTETIGTADPEYPPQTINETFEATLHTDWPDSRVIRSRITLGDGGFYRTTAVAHKPAST